MKQVKIGWLLLLLAGSPAFAQTPAARVGDATSHGGVITGPGVPSVLIGGRPAAVLGDQTTCPLSSGAPPHEVPHLGGPIVTAAATVFIGGKRAVRVGDVNVEVGSSAAILSGAPTLTIGQ